MPTWNEYVNSLKKTSLGNTVPNQTATNASLNIQAFDPWKYFLEQYNSRSPFPGEQSIPGYNRQSAEDAYQMRVLALKRYGGDINDPSNWMPTRGFDDPMWGEGRWINRAEKTQEPYSVPSAQPVTVTLPKPAIPPVISTPQTPNQSNIWQDTWQPTGQVNNGNPYSDAWKNISPNIGTKESTPSNTTVNTTNPPSGQGNFPKLPNITQDVLKELDSLNGVNTWGNFKTTGLGHQANPNYSESKGYYVNPYTGEYSF